MNKFMFKNASSKVCSERFIKVSKEDIECFVCWEILTDPQQCKNGHCFCKECLDPALMRKGCPVCKVNMNAKNISEALFAKNAINNLLTNCTSTHCTWKGSSDELQSHLAQDCPFVHIKCPEHPNGEMGCSKVILRKDLADHLKIYLESIRADNIALKAEIGSFKQSRTLQKYVGNYAADKPMKESFGVMRYVSGDVFSGMWKNGRTCNGTYIWATGITFTGTYKLYGDECHPYYGKMQWVSGAWFEGELDRGSPTSNGILSYPNGDKYCGNFDNNDNRSGKGVLTYANGDILEIEWKNDKTVDGEGKFTKAASGAVYVGSFVYSRCHGAGVTTFKNGDVHTGIWYNGAMIGEGTMVYADGNIYKGEWKDGKRTGKGTLASADNHVIYSGECSNDLYHGQGTFTTVKGNKLVGQWIAGLREGHGAFNVANDGGDSYWKDGKRHGEGIDEHIIDTGNNADNDTDILSHNGTFECDLRQVQEKLNVNDVTVHVSTWYNNRLNGRDVLTFILLLVMLMMAIS